MYSINNVTIYNFLCNKKNRTKRGIKVGGSSPCSNLNFKFNVFQNSNNKSVTNVSTYKLDFVLLLFFFFKLTTKLHKSSGKPDTVCTVNGVHRLRRGRGLDDDIQLGERTWSTRYQQGAVLYTENSTISTARAVGGSVLSSEKEPLGTTNMSPQKTILQWKINGRGDISLKISIKIVQLYAFSILLTCWQCWASEWWMGVSSLIFASQDYDQTHTQTPTGSAYAHHEFIHNLQLFLFPLSYKQQPSKKRGIKQFYSCLKITTLHFPCVSKKSHPRSK